MDLFIFPKLRKSSAYPTIEFDDNQVKYVRFW